MKVLEEGDPRLLAEPIDPLVARLLRRSTHALGIIDTHHIQKRHDDLVGWLANRFPVAIQLMQRRQSGAAQPHFPEQMVYPNPLWHNSQIAAQTNPYSNLSEPNIPYAKETSPTNFDSSQQEPVAAVWRLRRAATTVSLAATEAPDIPRVPTPTKATTVVRKASNNQTVNNIADNKGNNNPTQWLDLSLTQANKPFTLSGKPFTIAKAKLRPAAMLPSITLYKENQSEPLGYPLNPSNAAQNSKSSTVSISHPSLHSRTARTRELTSPEIPKPDLFVAQSPKGSQRSNGNGLITNKLPQTDDKAANYFQTANRKENSVPTNKPTVNEAIMPNTQTISPRFSKKEWTQLIESVSKVIGDKLLADLDRRGIRLWR